MFVLNGNGDTKISRLNLDLFYKGGTSLCGANSFKVKM